MKRTLDQVNQEETKKPTSTKVKVIIIAGYNGSKFFGSQKQPEKDLRTVEGEIVKALCDQELIYRKDLGKFKNIAFNRATRTDKKVHALQNYFGCKLRAISVDLSEVKEKLRKSVPDDIKIFGLLKGSSKFNTKLSCSSREYLYYLPSFCMQSLKSQTSYDNCHKYRIGGLDEINKVAEMYKGTNKFHNYTQGIHPKMGSAQRYIMQFKAERTLIINDLELIELFIKGQSFLYNQIRKMVGMVIYVIRKGLPIEVIKNSFKDNTFITPLAPGNGLILQRVCYDHYNKTGDSVELPEADNASVEEFKQQLIEYMAENELKENIYVNWLKKLDTSDEGDTEDHIHDYKKYNESES